MTRTGVRALLVSLCLVVFVGCGGDGDGGEDTHSEAAQCIPGETFCNGTNSVHKCKDGKWVKDRNCYPDFCVKMGEGWAECM